ncbi:MAG: hypothetical protein DIZ77_15255 [endosymbiont of Seepiophila jonesi]|uniref:Elongation factor EFG domain-containing protein n=1 Tax=endosymbiont of Lamellibrachia luymesi TaxID=2200907 RepID=A0A370E265_9GAMM|nr:MAG: hypothetical protein DIZ77_15255 [endosymbiont of Seepiophila jonesi]RDH92562.1 MAG: hypothetical protein DIZ79_03020 [endosymbiont of Lamellibrachia luymesi]
MVDHVKQATPVILEPIVNISITTPGAFMGDLSGDLSGKRGHISGTDSGRNNQIIIKGEVPLAELQSYGTELQAITGGEGNYSIEFSHYEAVPANIQQQLKQESKSNSDH